MSQQAKAFITYLQGLHAREDRRALAILRRGLTHDPGTDFRMFPYVEPFVAQASHERDARRLAMYAVASLYAQHPRQEDCSFGAAFGRLWRLFDERDSLEQRFIGLLAADAENIVAYLRHTVTLLAANDIGLDYVRLLDDLSRWMQPMIDPDTRDRIRQSWARDFYRRSAGDAVADTFVQH